MMISKKISNNKAFELIVFESGWACVFDLITNWTVGRKHDHAGFMFCFILVGYKILEFNFYDIRHAEDDDDDNE